MKLSTAKAMTTPFWIASVSAAMTSARRARERSGTEVMWRSIEAGAPRGGIARTVG